MLSLIKVKTILTVSCWPSLNFGIYLLDKRKYAHEDVFSLFYSYQTCTLILRFLKRSLCIFPVQIFFCIQFQSYATSVSVYMKLFFFSFGFFYYVCLYRLREEKRNFSKTKEKGLCLPPQVVIILHTCVPGDW